MRSSRFDIAETCFFLLFTALNLLPILSGKFFPTLDGPAHLYNSQLIHSLLFDDHSVLSDFFAFNPEPVPNWTGHAILALFNSFLPAYIAEKILLLFYVIGLPLAFRALIKTISPDGILLSYFIFPFTYSFVFFLGFYNFSIALIFMLIALNYWLRHEDEMASLKRVIPLTLFILLTYFSHIFVFGILMMIIGFRIGVKAAIQIIEKPDRTKEVLGISMRKSGLLVLSSLIPLALFFYYFYSRPSSGNDVIQSRTELIEWLKIVRPVIALNILVEEAYTRKIFYLISAICIIVLYTRISEIQISLRPPFWPQIQNLLKRLIRASDTWLLVSVVILFLYFKLPDSDGAAGYVSIRLGLLFFLFLIVWLSAHHFQKWFTILMAGCVLYLNFQLNEFYSLEIAALNRSAEECNQVSEYIEPNSVVLPLNYTDNWLHGHFSNYLGIDKPMIILENYECGNDYFPLMWNEKALPNTLLGNQHSGDLPCRQWKSNLNNASRKIDYVFMWGDINTQTDSCNQRIKQQLTERYTLVFQSGNGKLYRNNDR